MNHTQTMNHMPDLKMSPHLTALRCLFLVALHHGIQLRPEVLASADESDSLNAILHLMREAGLAGKVLKKRVWDDLTALGSAYPVMAEQKRGNWVIVASTLTVADGRVMAAVLDPLTEATGVALIPQEQFIENWTGRLVLAKRKYKITDEKQPFGFMWFMPEILRNGRYFRDIGIAAIMSSLVGFAPPLFFQIIIDKVIPHHSYQTLTAIVVAFFITLFFDSIFQFTRQYLMLFATNKIDARLASRTFAHVLRLPLSFFETTTAGVLMRHIQQTETVRGFLTGRLFQTLLDLATMPILLVGLCLYSGVLTAVVLAFGAVIALVIGALVPTFRRYLSALYQAEGQRQSDLVETIHGMRAVKSLALEQFRMNSWDQKVANSIRRRATVGYFSAIAVVITQGIQNSMQMAILGIGAMMVFDGTLSMGALVAFNMLAGRVTGPLVQIVGLINEYQQTAVSVKMLGKVMDHPPERDPNQQGIRPLITGSMEFDEVTFKYEGASAPALDRISFKVEDGQVIGVVGRSGSGKTTITRLIQGIHSAQSGLIRLNGTDVRHMDLTHLRRSIGVVLQDNILFRGTIRDNIAAGKPDATLDEVMECARLAGADEFIDRLPLSYETLVEESAANFSGGQKQRIAIARALMLRPRLLLFDEATSALDPDSEAIIQKNLAEIARGRTMVIISHRLSSLVHADAILVMERGKAIDFGPHAELLGRCEIYRHLWQQQTGHITEAAS
ncbi:MAG: peptidase domain-containing ABC transporter [Rhodospirillaceae bacterium]|nr:peptidase domain-containing ABC transporter [Rhodospirillaceae bacterium]